MTRPSLLALSICLSLTACAGTPETATPTATGSASLSPTAAPSPTPTVRPSQPAARHADLVVYATPAYGAYEDQGGLWRYDPVTDRTSRLASASERVSMPRFRTDSKVTYIVGRGTVREFDLEEGRSRRIVSLSVSETFGWDWDAAGHRALVGTIRWNERRSHRLELIDANGTRTLVRSWLNRCGREPIEGDEFNVTWSPDESMILWTNVCSDPQTVYILRPDGEDVIDPIEGTEARWIDGGRALMVRLMEHNPERDDRWVTVRLDDPQPRPLRLHRGANRPAVSPDGTRVAYDHDGSVYLYDFIDDTRTLILRDHVAAAWLDDSTVIATEAGECDPGPDEICATWPWEASGVTSAWTAGEPGRRLALTSTLGVIGRWSANLDVRRG